MSFDEACASRAIRLKVISDYQVAFEKVVVIASVYTPPRFTHPSGSYEYENSSHPNSSPWWVN